MIRILKRRFETDSFSVCDFKSVINIEQFVDVTVIEPTELKDIELKPGKGSSGSNSGYKKYSQTERERLDDRFDFLNHHLGDYRGETLLEVTKNLQKLKQQDNELAVELWAVLMYMLSEQ